MRRYLGIAVATICVTLVSTASGADEPAAALETLFEDQWAFRLRENPIFATRVGEQRYNDRLAEVSTEATARRREAAEAFLARLEAIDRGALDAEAQLNYDIFGRLLRDEIAEYGFHLDRTPVSNRSGFHIDFPELADHVPLNTVVDYENYIARLGALLPHAREHIAMMRLGIEEGRTLPSVILAEYDAPMKANIVDDPTKSLLYKPFRDFPEAIPEEDRGRLTEAGIAAIRESVVPGFQEFLDFMRDEYVPAARGSIAASALPDGRAFYRHRVKRFTTLDRTPEEIHQTGLDEVARIRREMDEVIRESGFEGSFPEFVEFLRTDPQFYADTPEQLMKEVGYVLKKMDGQLPTLFGTLPRMPYGIREIPAYIAPRTTTAYYMQPAGDGTRAGFYYVNTYDLKSRPLFEVEALSLHEAVPGHHLQIALQQELEGLPNFRRFAGFTAFVEGWGLYAERLGLECGFYEDPYSDFGRLSYEMWRACRLVVDSGMHYLGWTRKQAIDFMAANTALALHNIEMEVDRYISWPGQAVAYKTGELEFRRLRKVAEDRLGDRFDVREFHDALLSSGAVPLTVAGDKIEAYIASRLAAGD